MSHPTVAMRIQNISGGKFNYHFDSFVLEKIAGPEVVSHEEMHTWYAMHQQFMSTVTTDATSSGTTWSLGSPGPTWLYVRGTDFPFDGGNYIARLRFRKTRSSFGATDLMV